MYPSKTDQTNIGVVQNHLDLV